MSIKLIGLASSDYGNIVSIEKYKKQAGDIDDTGRINRAFNENLTVFFPKGQYLINSNIQLPVGFKIIGENKNNTLFFVSNINLNVERFEINNITFYAIEDCDYMIKIDQCHKFQINNCNIDSNVSKVRNLLIIRRTYYYSITNTEFSSYGSKVTDNYGYCTWNSVGINVLLGNAGNIINNTFMYLKEGVRITNSELINTNSNYFEHVSFRTVSIIADKDNNELLNGDGSIYEYNKSSGYNNVKNNRMETHYNIYSGNQVKVTSSACYVYLSNLTYNNVVEDNFTCITIENFDNILNSVQDYGVDNIVRNNGMSLNSESSNFVLNNNEYLNLIDKNTNLPVDFYTNFDGYKWSYKENSLNMNIPLDYNEKACFFIYVPKEDEIGKPFYISTKVKADNKFKIYLSKTKLSNPSSYTGMGEITVNKEDDNFHENHLLRGISPKDSFIFENDTKYLFNFVVSKSLSVNSNDNINLQIEYIRFIQGISYVNKAIPKEIQKLNNFNDEDIRIMENSIANFKLLTNSGFKKIIGRQRINNSLGDMYYKAIMSNDNNTKPYLFDGYINNNTTTSEFNNGILVFNIKNNNSGRGYVSFGRVLENFETSHGIRCNYAVTDIVKIRFLIQMELYKGNTLLTTIDKNALSQFGHLDSVIDLSMYDYDKIYYFIGYYSNENTDGKLCVSDIEIY